MPTGSAEQAWSQSGRCGEMYLPMLGIEPGQAVIPFPKLATQNNFGTWL